MVTRMRKSLIILPLLLASSPALAQPAPQLPPELTDPATAQRLAGTMQALTNALLNIRVGEMKAALQAFESWKNTSVEERASLVFRVGDLFRLDVRA